MTTSFTKNFQLALPDFRSGPWHDLLNGDITKIDALIFGALSQVDTQPWANNIHYEPGVTVTDATDASTWMASVDHTSAVAGTFAADRTAHPTFWVRLLTGFAPRGEWAHDTHYFPFDLAYQTSMGVFALCTIEHVSNAAGTILDDEAFWSFLVDFHDIGLGTAVAVSYNNGTSGLAAVNVQSAIDEVEGQIVALNSVNVTQGTNIGNLQAKDVVHETRMTAIETVNTTQNTTLTSLQTQITAQIIGYVPLNKAGDMMTGTLNIRQVGEPSLILSTATKGMKLHHDGANFYINIGDQNGTVNVHRPIRIDMSTGDVILAGTGEGVNCGGPLFAPSIHTSGSVQVDGKITSGGYDCRAGAGGSASGNMFNFEWNGSNLQAYVGAVTVGVVCDPRVKKDILPIAQGAAIDKLFPVHVVSYKYKNIGIYRDDGRRHIGFLADNLGNYIPEAVKGSTTEETPEGEIVPATLDPIPIIALLVRAVQELTIKVEALENRVV